MTHTHHLHDTQGTQDRQDRQDRQAAQDNRRSTANTQNTQNTQNTNGTHGRHAPRGGPQGTHRPPADSAPGHDESANHGPANDGPANDGQPDNGLTGNGLTGNGPAAHGPTGNGSAGGGPGAGEGSTDLRTDGLPSWLDPVVSAVATVAPRQLSSFLPPEDGGGRQSAVLILFGEGERGPELLLMERATSLRSHAGQPSFPGGALDPEDGDPLGEGPLRAALREAQEETGLDPSGVQLFGVLPKLYIPVSGFVVTPVLGWWRVPSPVGVVDPGETARVFTVPVADLTDPEHRATTVHPRGHQGPAFLVESALVWGFTAGVIDRILHYAGWERPWDRGKQVPLDWRA